MSGKHRREHLRRARRELDAIAEYPTADMEETLALADDMHVTSKRGQWHDRCPRCTQCGQHRHGGTCL